VRGNGWSQAGEEDSKEHQTQWGKCTRHETSAAEH